MKKIVSWCSLSVFFVASMLTLQSCSNVKEVDPSGNVVRTFTVDDFIDMRALTQNALESVDVDMRTGCIYYNCNNRMSPIMKSDGTVLTYSEWKEMQIGK